MVWDIHFYLMEIIFQQLIAEQMKTNRLLEEQNLLFVKNNQLLQAQLAGLEKLERCLVLSNEIQTETKGLLGKELVKVLDEPLLDKTKVMGKLGISDSTYRKYVKGGKLNPIRLDKIDWYFTRDLIQMLQESRLKGRT